MASAFEKTIQLQEEFDKTTTALNQMQETLAFFYENYPQMFRKSINEMSASEKLALTRDICLFFKETRE